MDKEILKKNIVAHGEYIELQVLEEECAELDGCWKGQHGGKKKCKCFSPKMS